MRRFHPFFPLPPLQPGAMHGDNRPKGGSLTAWQKRSVKAAGLKLVLKNSDIVACDLNDAPTGIAKEKRNDTNRELPAATGIFDIAPFLQALMKTGYDGPARAEPFNQPLRKLDDNPATKATADAIRKAIAQAGV